MAIEESKIEAIFFAALERASPQDRAAYLDEACAADVSLRQRVEALLVAQPKLGNFLQVPAVDPQATAAKPNPEQPGTIIGPYKLLQEIGEGGMGTVYMAEQAEPVRRRVALKIIKLGMDSRAVVARFEAERQALSLMDHPHIAKVLDAGTTGSGRPYFVMELVKGTPITQYADEHQLTPSQRLELFLPVCQAIQHAHQKGIIHRDIKPSNVLVAAYDDLPVVKVIDFGIAKATGQPLTEKTLFTEFGAVVGTLEYMSPEQARLNNHDIDTRSDIYSLGVLLYELLTGTTPLNRQRLKQAAFTEMLRMIREEEPPKPSTRLSELSKGDAARLGSANGGPSLPHDSSLASISAQRHTEPAQLTRLVRGELDWIVMKALEKDRVRRYETANDFALDVRRFLADEPVVACPPSVGYRLRKFGRRYKLALATAGAIALALMLVTAISAWLAIRATDAEALAQTRLETETKERERAEKAENLAQSRLETETKERRRAEKAEEDLQQAAARLRGQERQTKIDLSTFLLDKGLEFCERGEIDLGLLWLARSLQNAPSDADDLQRVIRANLAGWSEQTALVKAVIHHPSQVVRVAFHPDGRTLLTASENRTPPFSGAQGDVRLWDAVTAQPLGSPIAHLGPHYSIDSFVSPDGKTVLAGKDANTLQLWDVETNQTRGAPLSHPAQVIGTTFSAGGRTLLTRTYTTIYLWETTTGRPLGKPIAHPQGFSVAVLSPDGQTVLTAGGADHKPTQLWDVATGQPKGEPLPHDGVCQIAAFSPDGQLVLTAGNTRPPKSGTTSWKSAPFVRFWDAATGKPVGEVVPLRVAPQSAVFNQAGSLVLMKVLNTAEIYCVPKRDPGLGFTWPGGRRLLDERLGTLDMAFSPDKRTIVTSHQDQTVRLWSATGTPLSTPLRHPSNVSAVAFSPDGRTLATGCGDGTVRLWELPPPKRRLDYWALNDDTTFTLGNLSALSSDGKTYLETRDWSGQKRGSGKSVDLWDVSRRELLGQPRDFDARVQAVAFSPDGRQALASVAPWIPVAPSGGATNSWRASPHSELWLWEAGDWKRAGPAQPLESWVRAMNFGAAGKTVLLGDTRGMAQLWDVATWRPLGKPLSHGVMIDVVALSPDGSLALTGGGQEIRVWETSSRKPLGPPLAHQGAVLAAVFSPDGRTIATGSGDRTVRLWDVATCSQRGLPMHHPEGVTQVCFGPDGRTLVSTAGPAGARVWDVATGKPLGPPRPTAGVKCITVSPEDESLVLARGGSVERWELSAPPLAGEPGRLALWSEVVAGRDLDAANVAGWLNPAKWHERRERLRSLGGSPLGPSDALAWHERQARLGMEDDFWASSEWHLDHLIAAEPTAWKHFLARGKVRNGPSLWGVYGLHLPELAVADLSRAIALGVEGHEVWILRGKAHTELKQWPRAAEDFRKAAELTADFDIWCRHADMELKAGNKEAHRRACDRLLERFGQTENHVDAHYLANICLEDPPPAADAARIVTLAERALAGAGNGTEFPRKIAYLDTLGAALYRAGRFEPLIHRLDEALQDIDQRKLGHSPTRRFLLALSHHRLGRAAEAKQWVHRALASQAASLWTGRYPWIRAEFDETFANERLEETIAAFKEVLEPLPKDRRADEHLGPALALSAWNLANHVDPQLRDFPRAVERAGQAVDLVPESTVAWQYLGWVNYRAGNYQASIEALAKSSSLQKGGDCGQWIVLALTHGKLANDNELTEEERVRHQGQARRWYDQAVKQIDNPRAAPEDSVGQAIRAFRVEAAELLGVKE